MKRFAAHSAHGIIWFAKMVFGRIAELACKSGTRPRTARVFAVNLADLALEYFAALRACKGDSVLFGCHNNSIVSL